MLFYKVNLTEQVACCTGMTKGNIKYSTYNVKTFVGFFEVSDNYLYKILLATLNITHYPQHQYNNKAESLKYEHNASKNSLLFHFGTNLIFFFCELY